MMSQQHVPSLGPNADLVGRAGSRADLATPCLVLDIDALRRNIDRAARFCRTHNISLRPHAKTHKSARIGHMQVEAGAVGLCVATIGEAEALAAAGHRDLLVTSTFTQSSKIARAIALAGKIDLTVVADNVDVVRRLGAAATAAGLSVGVHVDVDLGRRRNGVTSVAQAVAVAGAISACRGLRLAGIQAYASHISHVHSFAARQAQSVQCAAIIQSIVTALGEAGFPVTTVTGGSTGTLFMDPALGCYTELQCGSYVFSDVEYGEIELSGTNEPPFEPALFVRVSVIGRNCEDRVTCDGGNKHSSAKGTLPAFAMPPDPGAVYRPDSDEHGIIELPHGVVRPALGANFELIVPHCDPTVNLYNHYHVVQGDKLVDIWPIEARGAF